MDIPGDEPDLDAQIAQAQSEIASGAVVTAVDRLQALIEVPIYDHRLHYAMAAALGAVGDAEGQQSWLLDAQTFHALQEISEQDGVDMGRFVSEANYALQIGDRAYAEGKMGLASAALGQVAPQPGAPFNVIMRWGLSLLHQGRIPEAITAFTLAADTFKSSMAHEFLLYACFFAEDGVRLHAAQARRWAELYAPPPENRPFANPDLKGRKLRIGYVAPTLLRSQLRQFIVPVLENHDLERVEVFIYCADPATEVGIRATTVRGIGALSDAAAASLIAGDGIDVLVDLWGHTSGGRLGIFALKPAPVQVAWINYVQTTGLAAIDYVLHADGTRAADDDELFVEKIWRLGPIAVPFRPGERLDPTPTPALASGHVTFASFNHPARLNDATVAAWAAILKGRPGSRLLLKYRYFVDPVLQQALLARFLGQGVTAAQIIFEGHSTGPDYLKSFGRIDLALDPSPAPGGTTSSEAVSNGVPLLTLRGPDFYSRIGTLRLEPLGLHQLVAENWDDYVAKALALAADIPALDALRAQVRPRFEASPLRDEAGFTAILEDAFRQMFERWKATA
jgi:protein O-GlcNAc transferase